jgi:hypothetical protein
LKNNELLESRGQKGAGRDVFITKLNPGGTAAEFSTYLSGNGNGEGFAIAVDNVGAAYLTGYTYSTDFSTAGAFQTVLHNPTYYDAFVAKISP